MIDQARPSYTNATKRGAKWSYLASSSSLKAQPDCIFQWGLRSIPSVMSRNFKARSGKESSLWVDLHQSLWRIQPSRFGPALALIELTDGSYYPAFPRGTNPPRVVRSRDSNDYYCPSSIQYRERVRLWIDCKMVAAASTGKCEPDKPRTYLTLEYLLPGWMSKSITSGEGLPPSKKCNTFRKLRLPNLVLHTTCLHPTPNLSESPCPYHS